MTDTVYLVDDHAILREGLRALLEPAGFVVVGESGDLPTALHDIVRDPPDCVLLDLSLGERSGHELLAELQRRKISSRVVVLSMMAQPRQVMDAVRMGAMGYVLKGASGAEVITALRQACGGQHYWSPAIARVAQEALRPPEPNAPPEPLHTLSQRERQVLNLVVRGQASSSIAHTLNLSAKTVETYRSRVMGKLGVSDITGLVRLAVKEGLLDGE